MDSMKTLTTSHAKARLGALCDAVLRTGKPVHFQRKGRVLEIREKPMIEPIDFAPVGDLPVTSRELALQKRNVFEVGPEDAKP